MKIEEVSFEAWCKIGVQRGFYAKIKEETLQIQTQIILGSHDEKELIKSKLQYDGVLVGVTHVESLMKANAVDVKEITVHIDK